MAATQCVQCHHFCCCLPSTQLCEPRAVCRAAFEIKSNNIRFGIRITTFGDNIRSQHQQQRYFFINFKRHSNETSPFYSMTMLRCFFYFISSTKWHAMRMRCQSIPGIEIFLFPLCASLSSPISLFNFLPSFRGRRMRCVVCGTFTRIMNGLGLGFEFQFPFFFSAVLSVIMFRCC